MVLRRVIGGVWMAFCVCVASVSSVLAASDGEPSVPYRVRLKGLWFGGLKDAVCEQSLAISLVKHPPATVQQLHRRAEDDVQAMTAVLKADGYLDAAITTKIETNRSPTRLTFQARKGPRYTVSAFYVAYTNMEGKVPQPPSRLGVRPGSPATVEVVDMAEATALRFLQEHGFPHPKILGRAVTRDSVRLTVKVTCMVDPGRRATLGAATIQGLVRVHSEYMSRRIPWIPGEPYNIRILDDIENELLRSGLFVSARVAVSDEADVGGNLPVAISVVERPRRTLRAGVSYYTDEGVGGQASWENRNLLGDAENVSFTLFVSEIKHGGRSAFLRPDIISRGVDLRLELDAVKEYPDAYESRKARLAMLLETRVDKRLTVAGGTAYEFDQVEQQEDSSHYGLVSLPLSTDWDGRDDKLNPSKGVAVRLAVTPYKDVFSDLSFTKAFAEGSGFVRLSRSRQTVFASRVSIGSIVGAAASDVPADKRYYAGGGGTLRGYKYQSVGELSAGEPVGGNALATVSSELRTRLTRTLGGVMFIDGGTAYPGSYPDSDTPFRWGVGAGVRYFMGFAPLRLDVAIPLQRRGEVDAPFQLYLSLGQSF